MKSIKILLFVMLLISLLGETASAAELRIITKETGNGMMMREGITSPPVCKNAYENGTVIHFKADSFPGSQSKCYKPAI